MFLEDKHKASYTPILAPEAPASKGFSHNPQQHDTAQNTCPACGTIAQHNLTPQPPQSPHYASLVCQECDRFIKWLPKPEKERERVKRSRIIQGWLNNRTLSLSDWERTFLSGISTAKDLSPKQQGIFDRIYGRLGGAA